MRPLLIVAALLGLGLTVLGAIGGHAPRPPSNSDLVWVSDDRAWQSANVFGFAHVLAALVAAILPLGGRLKLAAGWAFLAGVVLFAFSLMIRQVMMAQYVPTATVETVIARYSTFQMTVPVGGLCFMAGWVMLALAAWRAPRA
jgi:uncharacterized membrane protein YgdD (TMEM256/DUF423 family)